MPMELINIIPASDLAKLKRLAGDISAAEAPELGVLDEIASLAAEIATRCREGMRQQLLEEVITAAQAIFPTAGQDLRLRLAQASFDELANLAAPLDETAAAQTALTEADVGLMAARDRGDYAAMAPLAMEADKKKSAFAAASARLANRIRLGDGLKPDAATASARPEPSHETAPPTEDAPGRETAAAAEQEAARESAAQTADEPSPVLAAAAESPDPDSPSEQPAVAAASEDPAAANSAEFSAAEEPANGEDLGIAPESPGERRRLRNLIRQMRSTPDAPRAR